MQTHLPRICIGKPNLYVGLRFQFPKAAIILKMCLKVNKIIQMLLRGLFICIINQAGFCSRERNNIKETFWIESVWALALALPTGKAMAMCTSITTFLIQTEPQAIFFFGGGGSQNIIKERLRSVLLTKHLKQLLKHIIHVCSRTSCAQISDTVWYPKYEQ